MDYYDAKISFFALLIIKFMQTQTTGVELILFYVGYLTAKAEYKIHSIGK